jgi:hypothetical protein
MVPLALPTLVAVALTALALVTVWRTWSFPAWANFFLFAAILPMVAMLIFTILPLPCAVFAWRRACGEIATPTECYSWVGRHSGRLFSVIVRLSLLWLLSLALFGIPLLVVWPRTCLTPLVALFEDQPRIFRRGRRLLRQDVALNVIGGIYLGIMIVLGALIFTPRLILGTSMLGTHVMDAQWRQLILNYLWIFEALSAAVVLTALAMSWWISLTLLYHEIRWRREGEDLRQRILNLRGKVVPGRSGPS